MAYCPWSGKRDCGCTTFPFYDADNRIPDTCQSFMSIPQWEQHKGKIAPERAAEAKRWVAAGRPSLRDWLKEPEEVHDDQSNAAD